LRTDYTSRNSYRCEEDWYDPDDLCWDEEFPTALIQEAAWDPFLDLRMKLAKLRRAVASARNIAWHDWEVEEPDGVPRRFSEVLARVLAAISA